MNPKSLKLSIVIPVYNEELFLPACLDAIARQNVMPFEVIVVDNNSTDRTEKIAAKYPFVKLINENQQGVIFARTTGFNSAKGQIIGRIDADTILPVDWTQKVIHQFASSKVDAITGPVFMYDMPFKKVVAFVDDIMRKKIYRYGKRRNSAFLSGPNMALKKSAWNQVKLQLCSEKMIHEDIDLAIHLARKRFSLAYVSDMRASISSRRYNDSLKSFWLYMKMFNYTYRKHHLDGLHVMAANYIYWSGYALIHPTRFIWRLIYKNQPITKEQRKNPN